jgi:GNAT superfamily N-acetyltransferase
MEITRAKAADLIEILYLFRVCILDMNKKGLKHWNSTYPGPDLIQQDLREGAIYVVKDKGVCKGLFTLNDKEPEEYSQVNFPDNGAKPLFLQRMIVHPKWQGKGIAKMMIDFAQQHARENGYNCLRLDVYKPSEGARSLYEKQYFQEIGSFQADYQKIPFICYEKRI